MFKNVYGKKKRIFASNFVYSDLHSYGELYTQESDNKILFVSENIP